MRAIKTFFQLFTQITVAALFSTQIEFSPIMPHTPRVAFLRSFSQTLDAYSWFTLSTLHFFRSFILLAPHTHIHTGRARVLIVYRAGALLTRFGPPSSSSSYTPRAFVARRTQ